MSSLKTPIKSISNSEDNFNRVYICPECKSNLPLIQSMTRDENNDLIITAKCECKTFTISINEYVSLIKNTQPKNDINCYFSRHKHPKIGIIYCPIDNKWYCEKCKEIHDEHTTKHTTIKYEIKNTSSCINKEHKKQMKYYCYNCKVPLCDDCRYEHQEHIASDISGIEEKINRDNKFKDGREIKQYWMDMISNCENEGKAIIKEINDFIEKLNQLKNKFEIIQKKKIEELNAQSYLHRALFEEYKSFKSNIIALINFHSVSKLHSCFRLYQLESEQYYISALEEKLIKFNNFSPIQFYEISNEDESRFSEHSNILSKLYKNVSFDQTKIVNSENDNAESLLLNEFNK